MERKNLQHLASDANVCYNHFASVVGLEKWKKYRLKVYWFLFRLELNVPFCIDLKVPEQEIGMFFTTACDFMADIAFRQRTDKTFARNEWWEFNSELNEITHKKI